MSYSALLLAALVFQARPAPRAALPIAGIDAVAARMAAEGAIQPTFDVVTRHLASVPGRHRVQGRLTRALEALEQPFSGAAILGRLRADLELSCPAGGAGDPGRIAAVATEWLDLAEPRDDAEFAAALAAAEAAFAAAQDPAAVEQELLQRLSGFLGAVHAVAAFGLDDLDDEDRAALFATAAPALDAWHQNHFPKAEPPAEAQAALSGELALLLRVDRRAPLAAGGLLSRLAAPEFLASLPKRLQKTPRASGGVAGATGDVIAAAGDGAANRVVLGGIGSSQYTGAAALIIDLGGDDRYARAAAVDSPALLASAVLDLRGDDTYETGPAALACAIAGAALLVDLRGKDSYICGRFGSAAAAAGFAVLVDGAGDDRYAAEDYAQGFGWFGAAALLDSAGNDDYRAFAVAEGSALGPGLGALVDASGDDAYLADSHWPDVYGDSGPDVYHGAAQGYATGIRPAIPGGVAALIDGAGKDRYQAGNFSQGGAYYFGLALAYDGGGDDLNIGTRYSQGFGVHQGVAMRWDAGGNDRYQTRCAANLGAGWDEGVGWFLDEAGDDEYASGGLALGGAANSAIALFIDLAGADRYGPGSSPDTQGGTGDTSYYQEPSLGILIDLGGAADAYSRAGRADQSFAADANGSLFLDARARTLAELLKLPQLAPK